MDQLDPIAVGSLKCLEIRLLHFLFHLMECAISVFDHMIDNKIPNHQLVIIKVLDDALGLLDPQGLGYGYQDKHRL